MNEKKQSGYPQEDPREALERLMQDRTSIMVAHRLSTIQHADRIIVMHHGRIRESGTHQELLRQRGYYYETYCLQNGITPDTAPQEVM